MFSVANAQTTYRFVDDQPKLAPAPIPDVAAPKFSRIVIERSGVSRLEGDGTPGSQVLIKSSGVMIGGAVVDASGRWVVALERKLETGDHSITSLAAGRETTQPGDEVRVFIPANFSGREEIVAYDRVRDLGESGARESVAARKDMAERAAVEAAAETKSRAEDLATAASKQFSQIVPPQQPTESRTGDAAVEPVVKPRSGIDVVAPVAGWFNRASEAYNDEVASKLAVPAVTPGARIEMAQAPETPAPAKPAAAPNEPASTPIQSGIQSGVDAVRGWLKDASDAYERDIAVPLSVPANPGTTAEAAPQPASEPVIKPPRPQADTSGKPREAAYKVQMERARAAKILREAEERAAATEKAQAEAQRLAEQASVRQAAENAAKARDAERAAADKARKDAQAKKIEDNLKRLEEAQRKDAEKARKLSAVAAPAPAPGPLPSESELSRDRSFADTQSGEAPKKLEFTIDVEDDADLRSARSEPDARRTKRVKSSAARVGGWRSRDDHDARHARTCSAGSIRRKGRKHMVYVVQPGDTLWAIANRHYRKGSRYNIIYRANQGRVPNADFIRPCQKLVLPYRGKRV